MITVAQPAHGGMKDSTVKGVPQATLAAQAALEVPAKNVSVILMAPCLFLVTQSRDSARAALEPQEGSVMAASPGMHGRAQRVSSVEMSAQAFFLVTWLVWSRWP